MANRRRPWTDARAGLPRQPLKTAVRRPEPRLSTASPSVSFRGSTHVRSSSELAIWACKRDSGLTAAITERPRVWLAFFEMDGPGARYLAIEGRARVAGELDDEVYGAIIEPERQQDPQEHLVLTLYACRTGRGITAVCDATVLRRPSGRRTIVRSATFSGSRVIFSRISPRIT
jgi:hypothetical protein